MMSWLQSNRSGGDDVTDDQLGVLDNDTIHHKVSHVLLHSESGFGQGIANARIEPLQPLQEPEFLRTLLALVLEFSQPLPQHLLVFRTPSPALLEFRQVDRTDLVGIDEALHFTLHGVHLAFKTLPLALLAALYCGSATTFFVPCARSCPCRLRINRACLSGATTRSSMVRSWPLPFGSQGLVKSTYPAWGPRCSARPYDCQSHSLLTALVAGATVVRGTGAPLSGARHGRSGLLPWPAYRDATVWASHSLWWARAGATVGVGRRAANRSYRRRDRGPVAGVSPLRLCITSPRAAR